MNNKLTASMADLLSDPFTVLLELALRTYIIFIALSSLALFAGFTTGSRFSVVALLIGIIGCSAVVLMSKIKIDRVREISWKRNDRFLVIVWLLVVSLLGALLASSISRPDIDDAVYVPKAVFYTENPDAVVDKKINCIAVSGAEYPSGGVLQYYELTQAAIASLLGVEFLSIYHVVFPALTGIFICVAMFLVVRLFEPNDRRALASVVFLILFALALGETHRAYGNISFARAFHGKFAFLSFGVTAWIYFSLRFFILKDIWSWTLLLALATGMAAVTTTAMVFFPLLSVTIFLSFFVTNGFPRPLSSSVKLAVAYFSSLGILVVMALDYRSYALQTYPAGSYVNSGFPSDFFGQADLLFHSIYPAMPVLFVLSLTVVLLWSDYRKFFATWVALVFVLLLNPWVADWVIKYLTTENIYWRLFYLLPFPLISCVAFAALGRRWRFGSVYQLALLVLLFPLVLWGPTSVIRIENRGASLEFPGYKISSDNLSASRDVINATVSGRMFAPVELSSNILLLTSGLQQVHTRPSFLWQVLEKVGQRSDFDMRSGAYAFLYRGSESRVNRESFISMLGKENRPDHIVLRSKDSNFNYAVTELEKFSYEPQRLSSSDYALFSRSGI